jgi:hypothetical protein
MSTFVNNDVSSGAIVYASDHNTQGSLIAAVLNGGIDNANITSGAAIDGSKLADSTVDFSKMKYKHLFSAYRNSAQSLPGSSANTKIQFDTEEYDVGSNFDSTTNYRFTATITGYYRFSAAVGVLTAANWTFNVVLRKNGSAFKTFGQIKTNSANTSIGGSVALSLVANDYIEIYSFSNDTGANNINVGQSNTWFCGELFNT